MDLVTDIRYYIAKISGKIKRSHEPIVDYYRSKGVSIGNDCVTVQNLLHRHSFT